MRKPSIKLPLTALRTFEVAARRLSFKDAADELCVSPTTVSNQIRELERDWRCKLFIRKTRAVVLTDEGRTLSAVLTQSFADIHRAVEDRIHKSRRTVTLAVGPIFGARWMIPRLGAFRQAFPHIDLVLRDSPRITDAVMMDTHLAVDWGVGDWSGLESHKLLDVTYAPVLSAQLLQERGGLDTPSDLAHYPILHQRDRSEWMSWLSDVGCSDLEISQESTITDSNLVIRAATEALGVALGILPFVQSELESGQLVKPFEHELTPGRSFYLLAKPSGERTSEVAAVLRWLLKQARMGRS